MTTLLLGSLAGALLGWLIGFLSLFLIMLILIQRGKGGGLTGALGGPGGQSAFGSKAGDTFTAITIVVASIWGFTCAFTMWLLGTHAPTTITETNITAGPDDQTDTATGNELIIPPAAGSGLGGLEGIGDLGVGDEAAEQTSSQTPSIDLVPATPPSETTEAKSAGTDSAATESPAAESPAADPTPSDSPQTEPDRPDSAAEDSDPASDENG